MKPLRFWQQSVLIAALAACGALLANALAGPERHLAWTGRPPAEVALPAPAATSTALPDPTPGTDARPAPIPTATPTPAPAPTPKSTGKPGSAPPTAQGAPVPQVPNPSASTPPASPAPEGPGREIDSEAAFQAFKQGALFLDARRSADFRVGHIQSAHSAPVWQSDLEEKLTVFEALSGAQATSTLVLYCGGGDCRDSHLLAGKLWQRGFRKLLIYRDGYPDWVKQGRPIATGEPK